MIIYTIRIKVLVPVILEKIEANILMINIKFKELIKFNKI